MPRKTSILVSMSLMMRKHINNNAATIEPVNMHLDISSILDNINVDE